MYPAISGWYRLLCCVLPGFTDAPDVFFADRHWLAACLKKLAATIMSVSVFLL